MPDRSPEDLRNLKPAHGFLIGVDSDGCVFDSMELKHKECFCPAFINHFRLQGACGAARETWEFVNLYSRTRGLNRFNAAVAALKLLRDHPDARRRIGILPDPADLEAWIAGESRLSGSTLAAFLEANGDSVSPHSLLWSALRWTEDVAAAVERIVHHLPPIAEAAAALEAVDGRADCLVVSQTPRDDLVREWREHGIDRHVRLIAGQEQGTKEEHLALAAGGKYPDGHVLMVGDAPGDHAAANGFHFFPIVPGDESASWTELHTEGLERFFAGTFAGPYQNRILERFYQSLPELPPWQT